jgi:hypothetical protein
MKPDILRPEQVTEINQVKEMEDLFMYFEELGFSSQQRQKTFLLSTIQTGSGAHPASYPIDTRSPSPRDKAVKT